jgi:uncharacterized protein YciI
VPSHPQSSTLAEYLFYCRDKADTAETLERLAEAHWSFMDIYADRLIARGPSLSEDGEAHTGSLHIVRLATPEETDVFAYREPFYAADVYQDVTIRRWQNLLGRTMWEFETNSDDPMFLILAHADAPMAGFADAHRSFAAAYRDRMVVYGSMLSMDDGAWKGFAQIVQVPSRAAVETLVADDPVIGAGGIAHVEVYRWCVGGRR